MTIHVHTFIDAIGVQRVTDDSALCDSCRNAAPGADLRARWQPTETAVAHAAEVLADLPEADYALVPMWLPGKTYGIWTIGQPVFTAEGEVFTCVNRPGDTSGRTVPSFGAARAAAVTAADRGLCGRPGTIGYAVISRDSTWAVFEDFPIGGRR